MTECGAITTTVDIGGSVDLIRAVPNIPTLSVGKLYPNTKLKVKDLKTGTPLGPSKQGELCVSSPILSSGYWNRPEVNEQNFQEVGGDRWMNTGTSLPIRLQLNRQSIKPTALRRPWLLR